MKKFFFLIFSIYLYASSCYSVSTEIGKFTPVAPLVSENNNSCNLLNGKIYFDIKRAYIGCFKHYKDALYTLKHTSIPLKNPKIVFHKISKKDVYIVAPYLSYVNKNKMLNILQKAYKVNKPKILLKKFPKKFYGNNFAIIDTKKAKFLPVFNMYYLRKYSQKNHYQNRFLILYNGVYSLERLSQNPLLKKYIIRISPQKIKLNISLIISPTAELVINNKTVLMEGYPRVSVVFYFGKLYINNSKFYVWNDIKNKKLPREYVPENKVLFSDYEKPRPYFLGLTGSSAIVLNSVFEGLGYHSSVATFGFALSNTPTLNLFGSSSLAIHFFIHSNMPSIKFIGNEVKNCTMGFYTSEAANSVFIGNFFHNNVIYNFDPHDYSTDLICASNIGLNAKHAHGFITSRYVNHSIIANNIALKNHSCGIMLDRTSYDNLIYGNMTFDNGYSGISLQESPRVLIYKNYSFLNKKDGISIRNSIRVKIEKNILDSNFYNGVEVFVRNIDFTPDRNFKRDPYMKAASARIFDNTILNNLLNNIQVKNYASVWIKKNYLYNEFGNNYGGDLNNFVGNIIKKEGNFKLYGLGYPYQALGSDLIKLNSRAFQTALKIFHYLIKKGNTSSYKTLFGMYENRNDENRAVINLLKGSFYLNKDSLTYLGYLFLKKAKEENWRKDYVNEGFIYLIEAGIIGNKSVFEDLNLLRFFIPDIDYKYFNYIYNETLIRMKKGYILPASFYEVNNLKGNKKIRNAIILFIYKFKKAKFKNFSDYLKYYDKHYSMFNMRILDIIGKKFRHKDALKIKRNKYFEHLYKEANSILVCKKFLQKSEFFKKQNQQIMNLKKDKIIKKYIPELKNLLNKINAYRNRKISLNEILKEIK